MNRSGFTSAALRVLPPHQPLEADDASLLEGDDGLVVHHELLQLDRAPQLRLELQQRHRVAVHRLVEHLIGAAPGRLGAVHGGVRVAQDLLRALVPGRGERDPDAGAGEAPRGPRSPSSRGSAPGSARRCASRPPTPWTSLSSTRELVPTQPSHRVARAAGSCVRRRPTRRAARPRRCARDCR